MSVSIFYDGDCPFCSNYVRLVRLRKVAGEVEMVDLREDDEARERLQRRALDLDKGMAVETGGKVYHGADAVYVLSMLSDTRSFLNRLLAFVLGNRTLARLVYPLLRAGRNTTLFTLGRQPISERDAGDVALFTLFSRFFGLFVFVNACYFMAPETLFSRPITPFLMLLGAWLFLRPSSRRVFVLTAIAQAIDAVVQAPVNSNHAMLQDFMLLAFGISAAWHLLRGNSFERWFQSVRPIGRCLLLTMYVFGIFHKINSGFLDPAASCAVELWRTMPFPLSAVDATWMRYTAIYGTFVVEGAIFVMLVVQRWRHVGIVAGIGFHALLALSKYALYAAFSTLATALHVLFLTPGIALQIVRSHAYIRFETFIRSPLGTAVYLCILGYVAVAGYANDFHQVTFAWILAIIAPAWIVVSQGWRRDSTMHERSFFWSRTAALNIVTALFFLNCTSPYWGLKTAQSMNMYANLRLEGGVSNHLIFRAGQRPFHYLDDVVTVVDAKGSPYLARVAKTPAVGLVYYNFLSELADTPDARVSYRRNGILHKDALASDVLRRDGNVLHPRWVRKFFHFRPVELAHPTPCE